MPKLEEFLQSEEETSMREAFDEQVQDILENEDKYRKEYDHPKVGLEVEYPAVDRNLDPITEETRNKIIDPFEYAVPEIGATQVEIKTDPIEPSRLEDLEDALENRESNIVNKAKSENVNILRTGTNPFVDMDNIEKTTDPKYERVPGFHDRHRNGVVPESFGKKETVDPRNADIAALINSTQLNIEADSFEDAVDKANYTYMITPYLCAVSANSRFIDGKDTGYADTRMPLWEKSHDLRTEDRLEEDVDAGKMSSYYDDLKDYLGRVRSEPFIIHEEVAALDIGIGTYWKDSRIKFRDENEEDIHDIIVESRAISTQPTLEDETAMHGFVLGRLAYAQNVEEELMDIEKVNRNRYSAMYNGLDTKLYTPEGDLEDAEKVLEKELEKAEKGLEYCNVEDDGYLDILYNRLDEGVPSAQIAEEFYSRKENESNTHEAMEKALKSQDAVLGE
ncbi:MAG: hypothetical protein BRC29_03165 [Nanohaloarchaea archaeon SW_7_43_1]|nr:MAG: hypothetical protein BRC29_03165 [Nanohaloarchaea archaeon SW_7_43_1]